MMKIYTRFQVTFLPAHTHHSLAVCALAALASAVVPAHAEGMVPVDVFPNLVGLGVGFTPEFSGAKDDIVGVAPGLRYQFSGYRYVEWWGPVADINLIDSPNWQAGPMLDYRFGRSDVKDPVVDSLSDIDGTVEGGAFASYSYLNTDGVPWRLRLGVSVMTDLGDRYDGLSSTAWGSFWMPLSQTVFVGVGGGASFGSSSFMQTYYGITPADAVASGLPAYSPGGGVRNYFLWPAVIWQFDKNWAAGGMLFYQRLAGDAADSPIVRERGTAHQLTGGVGLGYVWK